MKQHEIDKDYYDKPLICVLCHQPIPPKRHPLTGEVVWRGGYNPWPLANEGRCCESCDNTKVTPERIRRTFGPNRTMAMVLDGFKSSRKGSRVIGRKK